MILGDTCTRRCGFCNVKTGKPTWNDPLEPARVARSVARMGLRHAVITSVDRDDLPDYGAGAFVGVIRQIRRQAPRCKVEVLTPDFRGEEMPLAKVIAERPDVFNHNVEVVPRLYPVARRGSTFERSCRVLQERQGDGRRRGRHQVRADGRARARRFEEMVDALGTLREHDVQVLTIGQYLRPTEQHLPIVRYWHPDEFKELERAAYGLGFEHVAAGPLVRSSYHADQHVPQDEPGTGPLADAASAMRRQTQASPDRTRGPGCSAADPRAGRARRRRRRLSRLRRRRRGRRWRWRRRRRPLHPRPDPDPDRDPGPRPGRAGPDRPRRPVRSSLACRPRPGTSGRRQESSGRAARRRVAQRERRVELAAAEAAEDDPAFAPDVVRASGSQAVHARSRRRGTPTTANRLRELVAPDLLEEWERRLDDFDRTRLAQPRASRSESRRSSTWRSPTRATRARIASMVRIEATLRDYVEDRSGHRLKRAGRLAETRQGARVLDARQARRPAGSCSRSSRAPRASMRSTRSSSRRPGPTTQAMRDEALVEGAVADAVPEGDEDRGARRPRLRRAMHAPRRST